MVPVNDVRRRACSKGTPDGMSRGEKAHTSSPKRASVWFLVFSLDGLASENDARNRKRKTRFDQHHVLLRQYRYLRGVGSTLRLHSSPTFVGSLDTLGSQRWDGLPSGFIVDEASGGETPLGISFTDEFEQGLRVHARRPIFFGAPDSPSTGRHRKTVASG
jgi:hypothetical protein